VHPSPREDLGMLNQCDVCSDAGIWLLVAVYAWAILVLAGAIGFGMASDDDIDDDEDRL
jgi:hypothetical protein